MNLDGRLMYVSSTAQQGVVGSDTRISFAQRGSRVLGRYRGGSVDRGCLVGTVTGATFLFRYVQLEASGELHAGRSACELRRLEDGRIRVFEHFRWSTRDGEGTNVFDEVGSD
jgi:hypothetical protein